MSVVNSGNLSDENFNDDAVSDFVILLGWIKWKDKSPQ